MRLAWFSPMPPSTSGIAAYSAEALPLAARPRMSTWTCSWTRSTDLPEGTRAARDFVWMHRRHPLRPHGVPARERRVPRLHVGIPLPLPGPGRPARRAAASGARAGAAATARCPRRGRLPRGVRLEPSRRRRADSATSSRKAWRHALFGSGRTSRLVLRAARLAAVHSAELAARLAAEHDVDVRRNPDGRGRPARRRRRARPPPRCARATASRMTRLWSAPSAADPEKRLPRAYRRRRRAGRDASARSTSCSSERRRRTTTCAPMPSRAGIADRVHVTGFVADADLPGATCRPRTSVRACAGRPTARRRPRGSAPWPPVGPPSSPTWPIRPSCRSCTPTRGSARARRRAVAVAVPVLDEANGFARGARTGLVCDAPLRTRFGSSSADSIGATHHTLARDGRGLLTTSLARGRDAREASATAAAAFDGMRRRAPPRATGPLRTSSPLPSSRADVGAARFDGLVGQSRDSGDLGRRGAARRSSSASSWSSSGRPRSPRGAGLILRAGPLAGALADPTSAPLAASARRARASPGGGLDVVEVVPGGPADLAGIRAGDRLLRIVDERGSPAGSPRLRAMPGRPSRAGGRPGGSTCGARSRATVVREGTRRDVEVTPRWFPDVPASARREWLRATCRSAGPDAGALVGGCAPARPRCTRIDRAAHDDGAPRQYSRRGRARGRRSLGYRACSASPWSSSRGSSSRLAFRRSRGRCSTSRRPRRS